MMNGVFSTLTIQGYRLKSQLLQSLQCDDCVHAQVVWSSAPCIILLDIHHQFCPIRFPHLWKLHWNHQKMEHVFRTRTQDRGQSATTLTTGKRTNSHIFCVEVRWTSKIRVLIVCISCTITTTTAAHPNILGQRQPCQALTTAQQLLTTQPPL